MDRRPTALVYRIGQLGDTVVALPAIEAIRRAHPDHRFVLLTDRQARGWVSAWDVLGPTGWFDDVVYYDTAFELYRIARSLPVERIFNLVLREDTTSLLRDRLFFLWWSRGQYRGQRLSSLAESRRHPEEPECQRLMKLTGTTGSPVPATLPVTKADGAAVDELLAGLPRERTGPLIAVGPGSKMEAKRWPEQRFRDVGHALLAASPTVSLIVVGGGDDRAAGDRLCASWGKRAVNAAGRLSIFQSAALLGRCSLYVGNDTGTMHLAAAAGVPCVAIFSARDSRGRWEPSGAGHVVLRHDPPCAGCMLETCNRHNECLTAIATDQVIGAVNRIQTHDHRVLADVV
jgi:ADP-heptose:LPS heptosyltransferase